MVGAAMTHVAWHVRLAGCQAACYCSDMVLIRCCMSSAVTCRYAPQERKPLGLSLSAELLREGGASEEEEDDAGGLSSDGDEGREEGAGLGAAAELGNR